MASFTLTLMPTVLGVARLDPSQQVPSWAYGGPFASLTVTQEELSVVCPLSRIPPGVQVVGGWRAFKVQGPLDFALTGVLAGLATAIAAAGVSLFAVSTYDTDYLLVPEAQIGAATAALRGAGHVVGLDPPVQNKEKKR